MLIGNGIFYSPRRGLMPSSGPGGGIPVVIPFHSAVSLRRTYDNNYLSFPPGTFQSAIVLPMKYGGVAMRVTGSSATLASIEGLGRFETTIQGSGTAQTLHVTGLKNSPMAAQGLGTQAASIKGRARPAVTVSIGAQPSAFDIAQAVWGMDNGIETGWTPRQIMRIVAAVLAGRVTGSGSNAPVFQSVTDAKPRVEATTDASGNRISVNLDPS
jgi:hypothetical protein